MIEIKSYRELHKTSREYCVKCYYSNQSGGLYCDRYSMLGIGYRRNCPVGYCDKFLRKNPTDEEIEANKRLNDLAVHTTEKPEKKNFMYRDYHFGKGRKHDNKRIHEQS